MALAVSGEWVRSSWAYRPIALSHTGATIIRALHSALTQSGWELAPWSGVVDDRHYLRRDRRRCNLTNDAVGVAGNVVITKVGAAITVSGMADGTASVQATGNIDLTSQPADGSTITVSDGTTVVTFEFDDNASVAGGNIAVVIGTKLIDTIDNFVNAVNAHAFNVTASLVSDLWRYNGDALEQNCGLHVVWNVASVRIEISAFLENTAGAAMQVETSASTYGNNQRVIVVYNNTLQNDWLIYCGEDGLYVECGATGNPQSIGHGMIATFSAIPEFSGTRDAQRKASSQGLSMDLFGNLKFSSNRNARYVDNAGANKNYTGELAPSVARGIGNLLSPAAIDGRTHYVVAADNMIGYAGNNTGANASAWWAAFGLINSPLDDKYKLSPLWMQQQQTRFNAGTSSAVVSNNVAADAGTFLYEPRWTRVVNRVCVADGSLLPFANIVDSVFGKTYRVTQVADGGRNANIAIEYPATIVSIPATPVV